MAYTPPKFDAAGRGSLTSDDYNYFRQQRRQIDQNYDLGIAQNDFQRRQNRSSYLRNRSNVNTAWKTRFNEFQTPYVERGLLNSGLYGQGYDQFRQARHMELNDLWSEYQQRANAYNLAEHQLGVVRGGGLDDVEMADQARRATVAEELRRAKQGL